MDQTSNPLIRATHKDASLGPKPSTEHVRLYEIVSLGDWADYVIGCDDFAET